MTNKKVGWFFFAGTSKRHYFITDLSLCGRCLLTRNPDKDQSGDDNPINCPLCREELLKRKAQDVGHPDQQTPGSVGALPQS